MDTAHKDLIPLGWSDWFAEHAACDPNETLARIAAVDREQLLLLDASGSLRAKLAGRYRYRHQISDERPCVGDWVCVVRPHGDGLGVITALLERRSELRRRAAGSAGEAQMIAANVDTVLIVQACVGDLNLKRLERYLAMVAAGGAQAQILLTKTDLVAADELSTQQAQIRAMGIDAPLLTLSNVTAAGVAELERELKPGATYCFVGSSGVGKSTLINRLLGRSQQATAAVSETGEGRHTTVRRELLQLPGGALVIDNPGMREFGLLDGEGLATSHADIATLAADCRYRDCRHEGEPGCAVRAAVESGTLSGEHLDNYLKLQKEATFAQLSRAEKRQKDRDFGRFVKTVKKGLRDD